MWVYHTNVRPRRPRSNGEEGNRDHKRELEVAYAKMLSGILGNLGDLGGRGGSYSMVISTNGDDDIIDPASEYHVKFTKSGFLRNSRLQRDLIQKFKPMGIYVSNPIQRDKTWIIEFSTLRTKKS